jgi:Ran GTPase-activating protein (RanGAP) involved in mRNA processing and transport
LVKIPFSYNLSEAVIEDNFSGTILSPLRIEPRIKETKLSKNPLKYNGFYELSKVLLFNQNITKIDFHISMLKSYHIQYFIFGLKLYDQNKVEELDLSFNFFKEDCSEYLANLLLYLNNLKTIILNSNELKRGISSFLIVLKNLYRQGKTKLEKLYLNSCQLDDIAFYELGELLKCKYCKLKKLFLNGNNIPSSVNFLKKIKKNNSLIEIYFNRCNIENKDTDDIMRIISNTSINLISLNKNQIHNIDGLLKIVFRTKLIKIKSKKMDIDKMDFCGESYFYNLDLGKNSCYNKNKDKIDLLKKGIEETTLYCLDFSQIIFNLNPKTISFLLELNKEKKTNDKSKKDED